MIELLIKQLNIALRENANEPTPMEIDDMIAAVEPNLSPIEETVLEQERNDMIAYAKDPNTTILVAFSGGKDSVALVLGLLDLGIDKNRIELWHHEVDGRGENLWDWVCTTKYCEDFAKAFGLKIVFSWREGGITKEIFRQTHSADVFYETETGELVRLATGTRTPPQSRNMFPAVSVDLGKRWCSSAVKISVMGRVITNNSRFDKGNLLVLTGERRAESKARAKYKEFDFHPSNTKTKRKSLLWRMVIDWSDKEVWGIMERYKVQAHPAYVLGWSRCSCQTCIFNSVNTWASLSEISPEKIDKIEAIEDEINFTLNSKKVKGIDIKIAIRDYAAKGTSFLSKLSPEKLAYWKHQATVEYDAPIIVDTWEMPNGGLSNEISGAE